MTEPQPAVTLTAAVRCNVCGTVPCATPEEADERAERHVKVTGHAATAVTEAARMTGFPCCEHCLYPNGFCTDDEPLHGEPCEHGCDGELREMTP